MSNRKFFAIVLPLLAIGILANDTYAQEERMYVNPRTPADEGVPPYSGAVRVGNTLYLSGSIGLDENGGSDTLCFKFRDHLFEECFICNGIQPGIGSNHIR